MVVTKQKVYGSDGCFVIGVGCIVVAQRRVGGGLGSLLRRPVIGQHHIAKRQVKGFYFWIAGNLAALVLFVSIGRWVTAVLYVYFLVMSLRGVRLWKALDHTPPVRVVQARGL